MPVSFAIDDQNDAAQILYRNSKAAASDSWLNGSVEIMKVLRRRLQAKIRAIPSRRRVKYGNALWKGYGKGLSFRAGGGNHLH